MTSTMYDQELVARARDGDHAALTEIYQKYHPSIYRYIYFRVHDVGTAEDIAGDVFVRMLEGIHRYIDKGYPISAWLYRIAHDRSIDHIRRQKHRMCLPLEEWGGVVEGPESEVERRAEHYEMLRFLEFLTTEQRSVIQLRFLSEMDIRSVAQQLGKNEGAVKALQHRALHALNRLITV